MPTSSRRCALFPLPDVDMRLHPSIKLTGLLVNFIQACRTRQWTTPRANFPLYTTDKQSVALTPFRPWCECRSCRASAQMEPQTYSNVCSTILTCIIIIIDGEEAGLTWVDVPVPCCVRRDRNALTRFVRLLYYSIQVYTICMAIRVLRDVSILALRTTRSSVAPAVWTVQAVSHTSGVDIECVRSWEHNEKKCQLVSPL